MSTLGLTDRAARFEAEPATVVRTFRTGQSPASRTRGRPPHRPLRAPPIPATDRVDSIDALRGFSMIFILGADGVIAALSQMFSGKGTALSAAAQAVGQQFEHAQWEGFHFSDLIFPLFIFVTGAAIVFSLPRLVEREGKPAAHARVVRRSLLLFALGLICAGGLSEGWPEVRLTGVLNRIALCYLIASLLFLNFGLRGLIVAFVLLLVGYWVLMTFVPVPGVGAGSFAKGANLANWIDSQYLPGKKYDGTSDPEGLLSTLPAIATCLLGVFAGLLLRAARVQPNQKTLWLIAAGVAMMAAGWLWALQFPVIKNIWTSSFVLVAGGWSLLLLGVFHHVVDVWGRRTWATVLLWVGTNAITLYVLNMIVGFERVAVRVVGGDVGSFLDRYVSAGTGRFLAHAVGLALVIALARFLYQRKIFLRV